MTGGVDNSALNNNTRYSLIMQYQDNLANPIFIRDKVEDPVCGSCRKQIVNRYLLQVNGQHYHTDCLVCVVCSSSLQGECSCFIREGRVYCKTDYYRTFGSAQCAKCSRWISSSDWVRRARDSQAEQIYHLACFACDACHRQLSTGEEFALVEKKLLCKTHYQETVESDESEEHEGGDPDDNTRVRNKSKTKRVRTTFTDEQLQILQANFQIDSNPDGQDLERIAQITGLSKRVTQVWFQNSRARQKKHVGGKHSSGSLNNNVVPGVMMMGNQQSSASHHAHHQINRVLTRDRTDNLSHVLHMHGSSSPSSPPAHE